MPLLNFGVLIKAVLLVLGLVWCKEITSKLPEDIKTLKQGTDKIEKRVVVFYWVITAGIMLLMINFVWGLISTIISAL